MHSTYEQWNSNNHSVNNNQQQGNMSNMVPADYLNFIASNLSNSQQDLLNSSTNWLNSSFNLPPELRYQHLNGIVDEITKDDLLNSTNSLNFSFKSFSPNKRELELYHHTQKSNFTAKNFIPTTDPGVIKNKIPNDNSSRHVNQQTNFSTNNLSKPEKFVSQTTNNQQNYQVKNNNYWINQNQNVKSDQIKKPIDKLPPKKNLNQPDNQVIENSILVYPHSFSHHFSTLTLDQHNYLLQQQRQLFLSINTNNLVLQQQQQYQQFMYQQYMQQQQEKYHQMFNQQIFNGNKTYPPMNEPMKINAQNDLNDTNHKTNQQPFKQPFQQLISSSSSTLSSPTSPQSSSTTNQSNSYPSSASSNNSYTLQQKMPDMNSLLTYNFPYQPNQPAMYYPSFMEQGNYQYFYPNSYTDDPVFMNQQSGSLINNNRYLFKQPYRQHRRTGPANELHVRLEECLYQFKSLDNERKRIEIENVTMNKKQVPNSMTISIPRLSSNPSRVDRLIVEAFREFNKTTSLISKLDNLTGTIFTLPIQNLISSWLERIYSVQAKRKEELVNGLEREKLGQPLRFNDDAEVVLLANSINELTTVTSKIRTTLWCALQISNVNYKQVVILNSDQKPCENVFQNSRKTNDFIKKIFQIKTDLIINEP